jgi:drug/metabolite transporter (DMT)-like permease
VVALALGPLTVVQPVAVMTLVLALPLGAAVVGRRVRRDEWGAAAAVVVGLVPVVLAVHRHAHAAHLPAARIATTAACVTALVLSLSTLGAHLPRPAAAVARAAAAAAAFATASAMARTAVTGAGSLALAALMTGGFAVGGFVVAQLAYRDGHLGGPLATITLVEPLIASILGVTVLGERIELTPVLAVLGPAGLVSTALGVCALSRPGRLAGEQRLQEADHALPGEGAPSLQRSSQPPGISAIRRPDACRSTTVRTRGIGGVGALATPDIPHGPSMNCPRNPVTFRTCAARRGSACSTTAPPRRPAGPGATD